MTVKYTNDASTTLTNGITPTSTYITVNSTANFPTLATGDYTHLTLVKSAESIKEIIKCTAITGNVLTVVRGEESTTPKSFGAGDKIQLRITAGLLQSAISDSYQSKADIEALGIAANTITGALPAIDGSALTDLPAKAFTTVQFATNRPTHLALNTQEGDVVVRTDQGKTYMRNAGVVGDLTDFTELLTEGTVAVSSDFTHNDLLGVEPGEHIDWTGSGAGTIHLTNLPATALTTVQTAVSEAVQLSLISQDGDVVVRSDESKTYMHNGGSAGTMADFTLLSTPTDSVTSVDGATGVVTLNHDNLTGFVPAEHIDWSINQGATNIHADNYINTVLDDSKLPLVGGAMTGPITGFESTGIDDNSTETAITINAGGNLGLGVTPAAWHSNYDVLQMGEQTILYAHADGIGDDSATYLGTNVYENSGAKYLRTDKASLYRQQSGKHDFYVAPSGTADAAISWTNAMTIDNAGNAGLGVAPEDWASNHVALQLGTGANIHGRTDRDAVLVGANNYNDGQWKRIGANGAGYSSLYQQHLGVHTFFTAASGAADSAIIWDTAMTIDNSGTVSVGPEWGAGNNISTQLAAGRIDIESTGVAAHTKMRFANYNAIVGSISTAGSSTSYNTSSDYRLKTDVQPMTGATATFMQLNPVNFEWIADATRTDGFLAHELQAVIPSAATGTHNGMMDEEYEVTPATGDVYTAAIAEVATESQVMETVEAGSYVNLAGEIIFETIEQGVTTDLVETVVQRQDVDGVSTEVEVEVTTKVPTMETVITTPAVSEVIHSSDVEQPETLEDGQAWRETTPQVMATRSVPDMQGIDQSKIVPILVATLQEALARIEALEA